MIQRKKIIFFPIDSINKIALLKVINLLCAKRQKNASIIFYANAHSFTVAKHNKNFLAALKKAAIIYPDGWGITLAARLFGIPLSSRLTAFDFFEEFLTMAKNKKYPLFFLGGGKETIKKTVTHIKTKHPTLSITGYGSGYFKNKKEEQKILTQIKNARPKILIIGMGTPMQELWAYKHKEELNACSVIWCVGGLFDYISQEKKHCPKWLGDKGFQWLWRLSHEPQRLWKRYVLELPEFFLYIMKTKLF